jgi:uncharacterized repeat protein (TIGR03943 family)
MILKIAYTGTYTRYVKEGMLPLLYAAGAVMLLVAGYGLVEAYRGRLENDHGHDHRFDPTWLLVLPAFAVLLLAPPPLGSFSASRSGTALGAPATNTNYPPLPPGDIAAVSVLDYASRSVFDQGHTLTNRKVKLSGFLMPGSGHQLYLARMVITCCAADARPVKVGLTGELPSELTADSWVEVVGTYDPRTDVDPLSQEKIPYLTVEQTVPISAPKKAYES